MVAVGGGHRDCLETESKSQDHTDEEVKRSSRIACDVDMTGGRSVSFKPSQLPSKLRTL